MREQGIIAGCTGVAHCCRPGERGRAGHIRQGCGKPTTIGRGLFGSFRPARGVSPYSIGTAMAMALAGARGETEREMIAVLKQRLSRPRSMRRIPRCWRSSTVTIRAQCRRPARRGGLNDRRCEATWAQTVCGASGATRGQAVHHGADILSAVRRAFGRRCAVLTSRFAADPTRRCPATNTPPRCLNATADVNGWSAARPKARSANSRPARSQQRAVHSTPSTSRPNGRRSSARVRLRTGFDLISSESRCR